MACSTGGVRHPGLQIEPTGTGLQHQHEIFRLVSRCVAGSYGLDVDEVIAGCRSDTMTFQARQVSIYLLYTILSYRLREIGAYFGRDRTTMGYACRQVEDLRDCKAFEQRLLVLEEMARAVGEFSGRE